MPVTIPQYQTPGPNPPARIARRRAGSCGRGREPMTSPTRNRRACGSRTRCLPGSLGRTLVARLKALAAATALSVSHLFLPAAPAAAGCETNERLGHRGAVLLPAGAFASLATSGGARIDPWRSREAGERAGSAELPGGRWGEWSADRFAQPADDGGAWTGSREMSGRGLVLVSSFLSTAGDSAAPGVRSLALDWEPATPIRFAVEGGSRASRADALADPFGADCERGRLLAPAEPSPGAGDAGSSGAALGLGPHRPRDHGRAVLAKRDAYAGNRMDWNGHGRVALSGLCFEGEGRGPC